MTWLNTQGPITTVKEVTIDPYQELANAIILQAVHEYRDTMNEKDLAEIAEFFLSDWFAVLTNIDGSDLLTTLRREKSNER